jgi:hypothetical protein
MTAGAFAFTRAPLASSALNFSVLALVEQIRKARGMAKAQQREVL